MWGASGGLGRTKRRAKKGGGRAVCEAYSAREDAVVRRGDAESSGNGDCRHPVPAVGIRSLHFLRIAPARVGAGKDAEGGARRGGGAQRGWVGLG